MNARPSVRLDQLLPGVLTAWRARMGSPLHRILAVWENVVGEHVARHTVPCAFDHGVLHVAVDSSVWAGELSRFRAEEILEALNRAIRSPRVTELRFTVSTSLDHGRSGDRGPAEKSMEQPDEI